MNHESNSTFSIQTEIKPLIVTPRPEFSESLYGYLLRINEENCYRSPIALLRNYKVPGSKICPQNFDFDTLSKILACDSKDLEHINYKYTKDSISDSTFITILGHKINNSYTSYTHTKICPLCISTYGYISVYGQLRHALICPEHQIELINQCPKCENHLSWAREKMLECKCGYDLLKHHYNKITHKQLIALNKLIRFKLYNDEVQEKIITDHHFPHQWRTAFSLNSLLKLLNKLMNLSKRVNEGLSTIDHMERIAVGFSNWPSNFSNFALPLIQSNKRPILEQHLISTKKLEKALFSPTTNNNELCYLSDGFENLKEKIHKLNYMRVKGYKKIRYIEYDRSSQNFFVNSINLDNCHHNTRHELDTLYSLDDLDDVGWTDKYGSHSLMLLKNNSNRSKAPVHSSKILHATVHLPIEIINTIKRNKILRLFYASLQRGNINNLTNTLTELCINTPSIESMPSELISIRQIILKPHLNLNLLALFIIYALNYEFKIVGKFGNNFGDICLHKKEVNTWFQSLTNDPTFCIVHSFWDPDNCDCHFLH